MAETTSPTGYAYRITWIDDECECDEGWSWHDAEPWTREQAIEHGRDDLANITGADYVLHVVQLQHGWPDDRDPFVADTLLEKAERYLEESDDAMIDETCGAWGRLPEDAYDELETMLAEAWHAWCRKHCATIAVVRMLGAPETIIASGVYVETP